MNSKRVTVILVIALIFASCDSFRYPPTNPERFKRSIERLISPGDSLNDARLALEAIGYQPLDVRYQGLFGDMAVEPPLIYDPIDYLPLRMGHHDYKWSWIIAVVFREDDAEPIVVDILVQVHDLRWY